MSALTYDDLKFPNYTNDSIAVRLPAKIGKETKTIELSLTDVVYAAELAGLNILFISDTGLGKTQLITDMAWHHFGGDSDGGNANWADGRPNFEIDDLFVRSKVDLNSGAYDSETARKLKEERTKRVLFCIDEINRAPKPKQNEFFDLADGKYTFNGQRYNLGKEGYSLFVATANFNKVNGDFSGTYELDRALLNRAHLTIDLDHKDFKTPDKCLIDILSQGTDAKVTVPPPNDISDKITETKKEILAQTRDNHYLTAFSLLVGKGLSYCEKDKYKEKTAFPALCYDCDKNTGICSLIKGSSTRTLKTIAPLAVALSHIANIKYGQEVSVDPLDAAMQAFRFTSYHGNLNDNIAREEYAERKQAMMDETAAKLGGTITMLKLFIPLMNEGHEPTILTYTLQGNEKKTAKTKEMVELLKKQRISYNEQSLEQHLKENGMGSEWIGPYAKWVKKK